MLKKCSFLFLILWCSTFPLFADFKNIFHSQRWLPLLKNKTFTALCKAFKNNKKVGLSIAVGAAFVAFAASKIPSWYQKYKTKKEDLERKQGEEIIDNILHGTASYWKDRAARELQNKDIVSLFFKYLENLNNPLKKEPPVPLQSSPQDDFVTKLDFEFDNATQTAKRKNISYTFEGIKKGELFFERAQSLLDLQKEIQENEQKPSYLNKVLGTLFAGAIGDTLGGPTEFFVDFSDSGKEWGPFHGGMILLRDLEKIGHELVFTDDTRMTLLAALGILVHKEKSDLKLQDILARLYYADSFNKKVGWIADERVPGTACRAAVGKFKEIFEASNTPEALQDGFKAYFEKGAKSGGNGALMRIAPYAFYLDHGEAIKNALLDEELMHADPVSKAAVIAQITGLRMILYREVQNKEAIVKGMIEAARKYEEKVPVEAYMCNYTKPKNDKLYLNEAPLSGNKSLKQVYHTTYALLEDVYALAEEYNKRDESERTFEKLFKYAQEKLKFPQKQTLLSNFDGRNARNALAWAVFAFLTTLSYTEAMMLLVNMHPDKDTDSIASICGALYGALVGFERIKRETALLKYKGKFEAFNEIVGIAVQLVGLKEDKGRQI